MRCFRQYCLSLSLAFLTASSSALAFDEAACRAFLQSSFGETVSEQQEIENTTFEFFVDEPERRWSGTWVHLAYISDDNPLIRGLDYSDTGEKLQDRLYENFKELMLSSGIYDEVNNYIKVVHGGHDLVIFDAIFDGVIDKYYIHGYWDNLSFNFFRVSVSSNYQRYSGGSGVQLESDFVKIIEGCQ